MYKIGTRLGLQIRDERVPYTGRLLRLRRLSDITPIRFGGNVGTSVSFKTNVIRRLARVFVRNYRPRTALAVIFRAILRASPSYARATIIELIVRRGQLLRKRRHHQRSRCIYRRGNINTVRYIRRGGSSENGTLRFY